jgi:ATP/maltotriose-dependent transcriptional regulator MalT
MNDRKVTKGRGRRTPLPAKLAAPALANVVQRTRLFRLLDTACRKPVVWIGAPAGSGKTTLAASYLAARNIKPLWYQIDFRDADPATFFAYLRDAIGRLSPRKRETLPLLTPEYLMGISVYAHNFFEELFARLHRPAALVFDNFQDLPEDAVLHRLLSEVLSAVPEGVTVMFLSRNLSPASFAGLQARQSVALLGTDEISLTLQETEEIARLHNSANLTPSMVEALHERTLGWAAGFTLALEHARNMPAGEAGISHETRETLFDYFASEIFERSDSQEQRFLVATAVLPQITAEAAQQLTGDQAAGAMLARLVKRNYFTTRLAGRIGAGRGGGGGARGSG